MIKIVGYIRVSTKGQVEDGHSLLIQEEIIKRYCQIEFMNQEYQLKIVRDEGKTARNMKRDGLRWIKKNLFNIDYLFVTKLDRLSRNLHDIMELDKNFIKYDVIFGSCTRKYDTSTADGKRDFRRDAIDAEYESDRTSERTIDGLKGRLMRGMWRSPNPPYGYILGNDGKLYADESKVEMIRKVYKDYYERNIRTLKIKKYISKATGISVKSAEKTLAKIVSDSIYFGIVKYQGDEYSNIVMKKVMQDNQKQYEYVKKEKYSYDSTIVCCAKCRSKLKNRSAGGRNKIVYLYKYCPKCKKYINESNLISKVNKLKGLRKSDIIMYDFNKDKVVVKKNNNI